MVALLSCLLMSCYYKCYASLHRDAVTWSAPFNFGTCVIFVILLYLRIQCSWNNLEKRVFGGNTRQENVNVGHFVL